MTALSKLGVEIAFGIDPLTTGAITWVDVSNDLMAIETSRSWNRTSITAGTATIVLQNDAAKYDPANVSSPYAGKLVPWTMVRISAYDTSGAFISYIFSGYVQPVNGFTQNYISAVHCQTTVSCVDAFGLLAVLNLAVDTSMTTSSTVVHWTKDLRNFVNNISHVNATNADPTTVEPTPQFAGDRTGDLLDDVVTAGILPTIANSFYVQHSNTQMLTSGFISSGETATSWLQKLSATEDAPIYVDAFGNVVLLGRYEQVANKVYAEDHQSEYVTFSDTGSANVPYSINGFAKDYATEVYNSATVGPDYSDFDPQSYTQAVGRITIISTEPSVTGMFNSSPDAMSIAQRHVFEFGQAFSAASALTIDVRSGNKALMAATNDLELASVCFVQFKAPGTTGKQDTVFVNRIDHHWSAEGPWTCDMGFTAGAHFDQTLLGPKYSDGLLYDGSEFYSY